MVLGLSSATVVVVAVVVVVVVVVAVVLGLSSATTNVAVPTLVYSVYERQCGARQPWRLAVAQVSVAHNLSKHYEFAVRAWAWRSKGLYFHAE